MSARYSINTKGSLVYFNVKIDNIYNNVPETEGYGRAISKNGIIRLQTGKILDKQSNYKFAIDFFNISGISLPLCFVEILEGDNDNINATQYGFCLRHTLSGTDFPTRVIYESDLEPVTYASSPPKSPLNNGGLQDFISSPFYYAVFTFAKMISLFNTALYSSWADMTVAFPASSPACPPYFYYDELNGRICLIIHQEYVRSPLAEVFWNTQTEKYVESIRVRTEVGYFTGDQTNFKEFKLRPDLARPYSIGVSASAFGLPTQNDIITAPAPAQAPFLPWIDIGNTNFYIMMQEYDSLFFWNNVKSIVFFSSAISVADQYLPLTNNPNLINSNSVITMSIASPSIVTCNVNHNFIEGQTIYISRGSYSVNGIPITTTTAYRAVNVTIKTFQLFNSNGTPTNVTAFNPAIDMWAYAKLSGNIGLFNNPSRTILSYFDIIAQKGVEWRANLYNDPAYRKYKEMTSDSELKEIDMEIYMQLNNGALIPYNIGINDTIDLKMVFRRNGVVD